MKRNILGLMLVAGLMASGSAYAQQKSWLDTANGILNSDAGRQTIDTLTKTRTTTTQTVPRAQATGISSLSNTQITAGLKDALKVGTQTVVKQLGKDGGFNLDPQIRIPLPAPIAKADTMLKKFGMGALTSDLETRMNRAAEIAAPKAGALFVNAVQKMTIADAQAILTGPQDSATQYLRQAMGPDLAKQLQPIISKSLADAGAVKAYDALTTQYAKIPLASSLKTNMNDYVTNKAIDGIFYYVAQEEAAIRANPAKRTTDILKTVFGSVLN